jgi:hypothetical protein
MSYAYQCFGALTAWSFLYGCAIGVMFPPGPYRDWVFPLDAHRSPSGPGPAAAREPNGNLQLSAPRPRSVKSTEAPGALPMAA